MSIKVGDKAPDFTVVNEDNEPVTLSELINKKVVLVFYPFDFFIANFFFLEFSGHVWRVKY